MKCKTKRQYEVCLLICSWDTLVKLLMTTSVCEVDAPDNGQLQKVKIDFSD